MFGAIGNAGEIAQSLSDAGLAVLARPKDDPAAAAFARLGLPIIKDYSEFLERLEHPRVIVMDMPPGPAIDEILDDSYPTMEPADVVIDASASYWCDTLRRYRRMRHRAIYYVDIAWITRKGQRLLIAGGDEKAVQQAAPFLKAYCPNFKHLGGPGIAHYASVIEECLANAMTQLGGEAALMMEAWPASMHEDVSKQLWPLPEPAAFGRAAWQLDDAVQLEAATPLLAQAAMHSISEALDEHRSEAPPPRVGPFQHPDEII